MGAVDAIEPVYTRKGSSYPRETDRTSAVIVAFTDFVSLLHDSTELAGSDPLAVVHVPLQSRAHQVQLEIDPRARRFRTACHP